MVASDKVKILLADEDALRRDGLSAVLRGNPQFEVVAQCPDGEAALAEIRKLRPDIAVVDLNLPVVHGIELVRRVRGEAIGTKVVILSGTADDDIIREVVRAGGDGYLLKNGPARHLIDAIGYIRDGGQYFSPQLRRDGLDRHLLEEPPRNPPGQTARGTDPGPAAEDEPSRQEEDEQEERAGAASERRGGRSRRSGRYRSTDPQRLRERLRESTPETENLEDRDYEILSRMAEGIRPILDRLEDIEGRVQDMEKGDAPVPDNVRGWLSTQIADTFQDPRLAPRDVAVSRTVGDLEARLPHLIEEAVTSRFHNMASKLQQEIEETHVRTLETFVKNIQVKLVQRVSALETDMSRQAEAMGQLREYSQRTEDNLSRLITGVDKLAQDLPKRLLAAEPPAATPEPPEPKVSRRRKSRSSVSPVVVWVVAAAVLAGIIGISMLLRRASTVDTTVAASTSAPGTPAAKPAASGNSGTRAKMESAEQSAERKDYATAEEIYKSVLKAEPNNVDAMKALASVLYREDKIDESAAILDKLPRN